MALAALGGILGTLAPGLLEGGVMSTMGRLGSGFLAS